MDYFDIAELAPYILRLTQEDSKRMRRAYRALVQSGVPQYDAAKLLVNAHHDVLVKRSQWQADQILKLAR